MAGKIATVAITILWLAMMGLFAQREIIPAWQAAREARQSAGYEYLEAIGEQGRASQMGIFWRDRRVGYILSRVRKANGALQLESRTEMTLSLPSAVRLLFGAGVKGLAIGTRFRAQVVDGRLSDFRLTVSAPPDKPAVVTVDGQTVGKTLKLEIKRGGETETQSVPFDSRQLISAGFGQAFALSDLRVGARWAVRALDPASGAVRTEWAEVVRKEPVTVEEKNYDAYLIHISHGAATLEAWADSDGRILKQRIFGFTFIREEPPADALKRNHL